MTERRGRGARRLALYALHWIIIANFALQIGYAAWMVFAVVKPEGAGGGPLFGQAAAMPVEMMVTRRLYAIEFWIATSGLAIYLALTEIGPRLRRAREG